MPWHDTWSSMKRKKQAQPQGQTRRHERGGRVAGVAKQTTAAKARKRPPL
jgi:hypothetical protein